MTDKLAKIDPETGEILLADNGLKSEDLKSVDKDISKILTKDKISFNDLKTIIWQKTKTTIGDDDPVMILWVMMQSALEDHGKLLDQQRDQITKVNSKNLDDFSVKVSFELAEFRKEVLSDVTKERVKQTKSYFSKMEQSRVFIEKIMKKGTIFAVVNAVTSILAFTLIIFSIFKD